jgi:Protein of unknown function (DUF1573)
MKKVILSLLVLVISTGLVAQKTAASVAKLDNEKINLGQIKQGNPTTAKFVVTNISSEPLIIEQANPTCGCTVSDYTKEPIAPGKTGYINATYNAASPGHFDKTLTVKYAGIDQPQSIMITGEVIASTEATSAVAKTEEVKAPAIAPVSPVSAPVTKTVSAKATPAKKAAKKASKKTAAATTTAKTK